MFLCVKVSSTSLSLYFYLSYSVFYFEVFLLAASAVDDVTLDVVVVTSPLILTSPPLNIDPDRRVRNRND